MAHQIYKFTIGYRMHIAERNDSTTHNQQSPDRLTQEFRLAVLNSVENDFTLVGTTEDETITNFMSVLASDGNLWTTRVTVGFRMFERDICVHHEKGRCETIPGGNDRLSN